MEINNLNNRKAIKLLEKENLQLKEELSNTYDSLITYQNILESLIRTFARHSDYDMEELLDKLMETKTEDEEFHNLLLELIQLVMDDELDDDEEYDEVYTCFRCLESLDYCHCD